MLLMLLEDMVTKFMQATISINLLELISAVSIRSKKWNFVIVFRFVRGIVRAMFSNAQAAANTCTNAHQSNWYGILLVNQAKWCLTNIIFQFPCNAEILLLKTSASFNIGTPWGAHMVTVAKVNHSVRGRTEESGSHIETGVALAIWGRTRFSGSHLPFLANYNTASSIFLYICKQLETLRNGWIFKGVTERSASSRD